MGSQHQVCLLLGSNIRPELNLPLAVEQLQKCLTILGVSQVWETASVGSAGPNFLNAALLAATSLDQNSLKSTVLTPLESRLGRVRSADRNAPRPIDLDIILFDGQVLDPALWENAYRAVPVAEVQPELRAGSGETLKEAAAKMAAKGSIHLRADVVLDFND